MNELLQSLDVGSIINVVLFVLATVFGGGLIKYKNKAKQLIDLIEAVSDAVEDNKVSEKELKDIIAKGKKLIGKEIP